MCQLQISQAGVTEKSVGLIDWLCAFLNEWLSKRGKDERTERMISQRTCFMWIYCSITDVGTSYVNREILIDTPLFF